jgi:hypothetical protein
MLVPFDQLSRAKQARPASLSDVELANLRGATRYLYQFGCFARSDAIPPDDANEFLDIVRSDAQLRRTVFGERRSAELIGFLPYVIKLMLDQSAPLDVRALQRVLGVKRNEVVRDAPEPLLHLLLLPPFLPSPASKRDFLTLADDAAHLSRVLLIRPHIGDVCLAEMLMIFVVEGRALAHKASLYPLGNTISGNKPTKPVLCGKQRFWWARAVSERL